MLEYLLSYHTDELRKGHLNLYGDSLCSVYGWADERIVTILSQQPVH